VLELLRDSARRERMGHLAREVFDSERGAVGRVMRLIDAMLQE
jgi:3-deoxy-D-manno-octulosonic-acid transferase